jgi:archaellum component FlaC
MALSVMRQLSAISSYQQGESTKTKRKQEGESMSNTPRTDEQIWSVTTHITVVNSDFARQLERELAEAKQEIERLDTRGIHSCHDKCQRPMCVLRRENAELRAMLTSRNGYVEELEQQHNKAIAELYEARQAFSAQAEAWHEAIEQRDRLAEALRETDSSLAFAENTLHGDGSDDVTVARVIIAAGLATIKDIHE